MNTAIQLHIIHYGLSLKGFTHFFVSAIVSLGTKPPCNSEVVIHHGEIKLLGGWQAVATRTLGRFGHSTSTHSVNLFRHQHKERTGVN